MSHQVDQGAPRTFEKVHDAAACIRDCSSVWIKVMAALSGVLFLSPRKDQNHQFESFSGLSEPSDVGDYKKPESRASPASMSL